MCICGIVWSIHEKTINMYNHAETHFTVVKYTYCFYGILCKRYEWKSGQNGQNNGTAAHKHSNPIMLFYHFLSIQAFKGFLVNDFRELPRFTETVFMFYSCFPFFFLLKIQHYFNKIIMLLFLLQLFFGRKDNIIHYLRSKNIYYICYQLSVVYICNANYL